MTNDKCILSQMCMPILLCNKNWNEIVLVYLKNYNMKCDDPCHGQDDDDAGDVYNNNNSKMMIKDF